MNEEEYKSVVENMHMTVGCTRVNDHPVWGICTQYAHICTKPHAHNTQNGLIFGLPVVLDTDRDDITVGDTVLLKYQGVPIATVTIDSKWTPNKPVEALKCYGTTSIEHPAVQMITMERGKYYMGGKVKGLTLPKREFQCATPAEVCVVGVGGWGVGGCGWATCVSMPSRCM